MVICLEQGADLHTAQLMPLPLTVSCSSKIQIGFTVPAHPGSLGQRAVKRVCVRVIHKEAAAMWPVATSTVAIRLAILNEAARTERISLTEQTSNRHKCI